MLLWKPMIGDESTNENGWCACGGVCAFQFRQLHTNTQHTPEASMQQKQKKKVRHTPVCAWERTSGCVRAKVGTLYSAWAIQSGKGRGGFFFFFFPFPLEGKGSGVPRVPLCGRRKRGWVHNLPCGGNWYFYSLPGGLHTQSTRTEYLIETRCPLTTYSTYLPTLPYSTGE